MDAKTAIAEAQRLLAHARAATAQGALNIARTELDRTRFKREMATVDWTLFVRSADYHYFVGRILLSQDVHLYGLLCAHQCVENYLKAYLAFAAPPPPPIHELQKLLQHARATTKDMSSFLHSADVETVCQKFEPFYEIGRYPVQVTRPKDGKYVAMPRPDRMVLDYFVNQIRTVLPPLQKGWDLLGSQGHIDLGHVKELHPQFYSLFTQDNPNCV